MNKKLQIIIILTLILFSSYLTAYTITAHGISSKHIIEFNNDLYWRTSPSGSLFPWPREPGMLQALSKVNEIDKIIYYNLIKPFTLLISSLIVWIITSILILKSLKHLKRSSSSL